MKLKIISAAALSVIGLASIGSMESSTPFIKAANAQSGSRLCGYLAQTQVISADGTKVEAGSQFIGIEARDDYNSYTENCNNAINGVAATLLDPAKNALLKTMTFTRIYKGVCETPLSGYSITDQPNQQKSTFFTSSTHTNVDMCDYMQAHTSYTVKKYNSTNTTVYKVN